MIPLFVFPTSFKIFLNANIDKQELKIGEYFTYTIKIRRIGNSNIEMSSPIIPRLDWAVQFFTSSSSRVNIVGNNAESVTTYKIKYRSVKEGEHIFPSIKMPYYNPETETTIELKVDPIKVKITKGAAHLNIIFPILFFLIIAIIVIIMLVKYNESKIKNNLKAGSTEEKEKKKDIYEELKLLTNKNEKLEKFNNTIKDYLHTRYGIERNILRKEAKKIIKKKEFNVEKKEILYDILDFLYIVKYTGFIPPDEEINSWIDKFKKISE
jgi:large-conductance mechanosensitive channel